MARKRLGRQSGQVAVEAAIVMPLHVFLMLGLMQLFLMHHARLMTKYAAYKAVRAGSMKNARISEMERAATAALLPMIAEGRNGMDVVFPATTGAQAVQKWMRVSPPGLGNRMMELPTVKHVEVMICGPLRRDVPGGNEIDHDDPRNFNPDLQGSNNPNWARAHATKLRAQITFNYRMPIPFANAVFFNIARGLELSPLLRMGSNADRIAQRARYTNLQILAGQGVYVMPIRANYTMRMHSSIFVNQAPLPDANNCSIPWDPS